MQTSSTQAFVTATIFTEEIDSAVARNSETTSRLAPSGSRVSGNHGRSRKPQVKGRAMPLTEAAHRRPAHAAQQRHVGLRAGEQQEQQDAELRKSADHRLLLGRGRKQQLLRLRPDQAEDPSTIPAISWPLAAGWPI
jgi:hypothetical protein